LRDKLLTLGLLESAAVLGLGVVFTDTYNTGTLKVCYHSINIHFILFRVEFQDGSSISILKNKATSPQNLQQKIKKVSKNS
jgi:hypothetical protein